MCAYIYNSFFLSIVNSAIIFKTIFAKRKEKEKSQYAVV